MKALFLALALVACKPALDATATGGQHQDRLDECLIKAKQNTGTRAEYFQCACAVDDEFQIPKADQPQECQ